MNVERVEPQQSRGGKGFQKLLRCYGTAAAAASSLLAGALLLRLLPLTRGDFARLSTGRAESLWSRVLRVSREDSQPQRQKRDHSSEPLALQPACVSGKTLESIQDTKFQVR
jgi:hypothetical protein